MSRCRNVSSNRDDLRYCDSRPGAGDSGCWCCDSQRAVSDSEVGKGVTGQTAFTHMRRGTAGAREAVPLVRHLAESWIRDGSGASGVAREPDGAQTRQTQDASFGGGRVEESMRARRLARFAGLPQQADVASGEAAAINAHSLRFRCPLVVTFTSLARTSHHASWRLALVVLCKPFRQSVTTCRRQPSGGRARWIASDIRLLLPLLAE